jgi:GNAT superfamily N-acetyltransferase
MLKAVQNYSELSSLGSSPYSAKIQAFFKTYGNEYGFARSWVQNGDTAVCSVDGNITIECTGNTDFDELKHFLNYIPYASVITDEKYCENLGMRPDLSSFTVEYCGDSEKKAISFDDNYKDVYALLVSSGFELGEYGAFLADFASRVNNGCAALSTIYDNSILAATASALFIGENDVLLGAVATDKEKRGRGYASQLVKALASYYATDKKVFLFCREDSLSEFYKKCGFCIVGRWTQINNG